MARPAGEEGPRPVKRERVRRGEEEGTHQDHVERRVLRSKYLALHNKITDERDDLTSVDSDKFESIIKEVEDLHQQVQKPREQVADAEALLGITSTLVSSVKSQSSSEGVTAADFISSLILQFAESARRGSNADDAHVSIKWNGVGLAVSSSFGTCRSLSTMVGPMNTEIKARKAVVQRKRHVKPTETAHPEQVDDSRGEEKTDTDKNMSTIFEILKREKKVRLEHLILNRKSFAQTVENLFALSFLVKDGRVEITVDDTGAHHISPRNAPAAKNVMSGEVAYSHFVFRFDFRDWKQMTTVVSDSEQLMAHRESQTDSQFERPPPGCNSQGTQPRTPIRKLSRNRGRVIQEESVAYPQKEEIVADSDTEDVSGTMATGLRRCKQKLT